MLYNTEKLRKFRHNAKTKQAASYITIDRRDCEFPNNLMPYGDYYTTREITKAVSDALGLNDTEKETIIKTLTGPTETHLRKFTDMNDTRKDPDNEHTIRWPLKSVKALLRHKAYVNFVIKTEISLHKSGQTM